MRYGFTWVRQGNRILLGKNSPEIVSFPTGTVTFGRNAGLGVFPSASEVGSYSAQNGQVMLRLKPLGADARHSFIADRSSCWWVTGFLVCVLDESL